MAENEALGSKWPGSASSAPPAWSAVLEHSSETVLLVDAVGTVLYANPAALRTVPGASQGGAAGTLLSNVHPDDTAAVAAVIAEVAAGGGSRPLAFRARGGADWRRLEGSATSYLLDESMGWITVNATDVTEHLRARQLLEDQSHILELIARDAPLVETLEILAARLEQWSGGAGAVMLLDPRAPQVITRPGSLEPFAGGMRRILLEGRGTGPPVAAAGRRPLVTMDMQSDPRWSALADVAATTGLRACWSVPVMADRDDTVVGAVSVYWPEPRAPTSGDWEMLRTAARLAGLAIAREQASERLDHEGTHDSLTSLPNRSLFFDRLAHALIRGERAALPIAVLFIDLDHFKEINDRLGHSVGDAVLVEASRRLSAVVRPADTVARLGGDEFAVMCEALASPQEVGRLGERIIDALIAPYEIDGHRLSITASVGAAMDDLTHSSPQVLVQQADAAMYHAKSLGRNRLHLFDVSMLAGAMARFETVAALRPAIERGEFTLHYQPQVSLSSGGIVGAEALLRWEHPARGTLLPGEFISLADDTGLIVPLGAWVLAEACRQAVRWENGAGGGTPMAVNVSTRQLAHPLFREVVAEALAESGLDAQRLVLEVSEPALTEEADDLDDCIAGLRRLGVRFAVDDFGTGDSSLLQLKRLPVDVLKIDRSFVDGLGRGQDDDAIVTAIIQVAKGLDLLVVAVGVESQEQADRLRALGCTVAQGYHFARPMPDGLRLSDVASLG